MLLNVSHKKAQKTQKAQSKETVGRPLTGSVSSLCLFAVNEAHARTRVSFNQNWQFRLGDASWRQLNEVMEQRTGAEGGKISRKLVAIVRNLDKTRPITSACNTFNLENTVLTEGDIDLVGPNYNQAKSAQFQEMFPRRPFIWAETNSAVATRGSYTMPADEVRHWPRQKEEILKLGPDYQCSAYDNSTAPWGSTHEETWNIVKKNDFISGMYIWTGWDYIGEPTPFPWARTVRSF